MDSKKAVKIHIEGLVQGVGFRPFVYRTANRFKLNGWVNNTNQNVEIHAEGTKKDIDGFTAFIQKKHPAPSVIETIDIKPTQIQNHIEFKILGSKDISNNITIVGPDISICNECLSDLKKQPHRINYPLINCTHCGPRFSIIKNLPYDRHHTTMVDFKMCPSCESEYRDILNRRFHAQPVACNQCGPKYYLKEGHKITEEIEKIISETAFLIDSGKIVAIKGSGGYHLACDATNSQAVEKLRQIKNREKKPFAVMFMDIETIRKYYPISPKEEEELLSWQRPIVLINGESEYFAPKVCMDIRQIGAMLPYMPFHHLLFEKTKTAVIVLTSGNFSDEPIIINDDIARDSFLEQTNGIVYYNREIHNRTDDSVSMVINESARIIRRSRGYAPLPINLPFNAEGVLATGAELANTFCLGKGKKAIMSQHIGDLKNYETYNFYTETIEKFKQLFRFIPKLIVCDHHPDYLSTGYAEKQGLDMLSVQHHHAHIASCMVENGHIDKTIGFSFDGTGYGDDGNIWGSEVMICDLQSYERKHHFEYLPLPGGDKAVEQPWRTAVACLYKAFGNNLANLDIPFLKTIKAENIAVIIEMMENDINCPLSCSAGRYFDAISAMLNICTDSNFHAEAAMRLETYINGSSDEYYEFETNETISMTGIIKQIVDDIKKCRSNNLISLKFHNTISNIIFVLSKKLREETGINNVALSGGVFQNRYLMTVCENNLKTDGFHVLSQKSIPCNDAGIALGQLAIAVHKTK